MFLSADPGPEPPGGPASFLWTNRTAVRSTSPMSPRPSPDIVWPTGLLTRPPSLPGICCWVIELTFLKEVAWRVTGSWQSSRHVALQNSETCAVHTLYVSNNKRNNEAVKHCMTLPGSITMRMTAFIPLLGLEFLAGNYNVQLNLKKGSNTDVW